MISDPRGERIPTRIVQILEPPEPEMVYIRCDYWEEDKFQSCHREVSGAMASRDCNWIGPFWDTIGRKYWENYTPTEFGEHVEGGGIYLIYEEELKP